jgi:hypothetical protein
LSIDDSCSRFGSSSAYFATTQATGRSRAAPFGAQVLAKPPRASNSTALAATPRESSSTTSSNIGGFGSRSQPAKGTGSRHVDSQS